MAKIIGVLENSVGEELGIKPGDDLIGVNNLPLKDVLQYFYFDKQQKLTLNVKSKEGTYIFYKVEKDPSEILGLEFDDSLDVTPTQSVSFPIYNYKKDLPRKIKNNLDDDADDWRLSFLKGNYVSLTNLTKQAIKRILKEKPSPLYIDFPAFDKEVAQKLLGLKKQKNVYKILKKFAKNKIVMHIQIVLCSTINDGEVLKHSIKKLSKLYPYINTVAVIPAIVSDYVDSNNPIEPLMRTSADNCLTLINRFNIWFNQKHNSNFVFASDEIYQKAKRAIPNANYYGDFCQLKNGVGTIAKMRKEVNDYLKKIKTPNSINRRANIVASECYFEFMNEIAERINNRFKKVKVKVYKILNNSLGRNIISNELICGQDVISQLTNKGIVGKIIILRNMLCAGDENFIDDVTVVQVSKELGLPIKIVDMQGDEIINEILQEDKK